MKKLLSLFLAIVIAASLISGASAIDLIGDVNSDGNVNSSDALTVLKYSTGISSENFNEAVADLNNDNLINSVDALIILKISVGIIDTPTHDHSFSEWIIKKNATCTEDGLEIRTCVCGESEEKIIPKSEHTIVIDKAVEATCTSSGLSEGSHCSKCGTIIKSQNVISATGHKFNNGICENCGQRSNTISAPEMESLLNLLSVAIQGHKGALECLQKYYYTGNSEYASLSYKYFEVAYDSVTDAYNLCLKYDDSKEMSYDLNCSIVILSKILSSQFSSWSELLNMVNDSVNYIGNAAKIADEIINSHL